jgi:hypothetical protein
VVDLEKELQQAAGQLMTAGLKMISIAGAVVSPGLKIVIRALGRPVQRA